MFILTPPVWWSGQPFNAEVRQSAWVFGIYFSFTSNNHIELKNDRHADSLAPVWALLGHHIEFILTPDSYFRNDTSSR